MTSVNWNDVGQAAIAAATTSLGTAWNSVAPAATHSIQMLVDTAAYIDANQDQLSSVDRQLLVNNQMLAMQNVLIGYEEIGIAAAEQAVAAAWGVISTALQTAISIA